MVGLVPPRVNILINRDVVFDFRGFANDAEPVIKEKPLTDLGSGMNVDRRQKSGKVVDEPSQKIQPAFPQPMSEPVEAKGQNSRIKQHVPVGPGRRIPGLDRVR